MPAPDDPDTAARPPSVAERGLSVVIPAYNEEDSIERMVAAVHEAGGELCRRGDIDDYEIVVVDDCSVDRTAEICDRMAATDARFRVVHHDTNRKLGGALRSGFGASRGRWVLYTDADLPFDLLEVVKAFRLLHYYDADIVSAYRFGRTREGALRSVYSFAYNAILRIRFKLRVRDVNFAAKLISREVLDAFPLCSEGSFIDAELLIRAEHAGFKVIQFGLDYFPRTRGESTLSSIGVITTLLKEMNALAPQLRGTATPSPETPKTASSASRRR